MGAPHRTEILVGVGCVVLTANKVLQLIEMTTACQDACQLYREHHFLDESVKAGCGLSLLWEFLHTTPSARRLFKSQCFYKNFILFRDFSVITASYFITTGISVTVKYIFVSE